jgi:general stress protein YciG
MNSSGSRQPHRFDAAELPLPPGLTFPFGPASLLSLRAHPYCIYLSARSQYLQASINNKIGGSWEKAWIARCCARVIFGVAMAGSDCLLETHRADIIDRVAKTRRPLSITEVARMGGEARAEALGVSKRREIARKGGRAAAVAKANCLHPVKGPRYSPKDGRRLPGVYCASCRRKLR